MNDHDLSSRNSADLCNNLDQELSKRIQNLSRKKVKRWCCFFEKGKKRFAYVTHRKGMNRIEVWFLGEIDNLEKYSGLDIRKRNQTSGGFGKDFKARFYVDNISQLPRAIDLLYNISYRAS